MPTRAHTRRDPRKGKKEFSTNNGFTLIETMIVLAVAAIIMSLALPSYRSIVEKRQVTSAAEQLTAFLGTMKGEAVKLNQNLAFSYSSSDQCMGFQQTMATCDCSADSTTCQVGYDDDLDGDYERMTDRTFQFSQFKYPGVVSAVNFSGGGSVLVYDSVRGVLAPAFSSGLAVSLVSSGGQYALNVEIDRLGRVTICSPQSDDHSPVPGYDQC